MRDRGRPPPSRAPATASSVRCSDHAMDLVKVKVQSRVGQRRGVRPHRPKIVSKRSTPAQGCTPLKDKVWDAPFWSRGRKASSSRRPSSCSSSAAQGTCRSASAPQPSSSSRFHFESILDTSGKNYARPNKNCNLTSWVDGCEPDWWCTADQPWWCYCRHRL